METVWQSQGYQTPNTSRRTKRKRRRILQTYHAAAEARAEQTKTFLTEKMLKWDMGPFVLTGRIDRIDEHLQDGALEIVDYKSGRLGVTEEDVKGALAMSVYQLLAKRNHPDRRVFATIHALRGGVTASASFTDDECWHSKKTCAASACSILEKDFEAVRPVPLPRRLPRLRLPAPLHPRLEARGPGLCGGTGAGVT